MVDECRFLGPPDSHAAHSTIVGRSRCRLGVGDIMPAHQRWWSGRAPSELTKIAITDAVALTVISRIKDLRHHASI